MSRPFDYGEPIEVRLRNRYAVDEATGCWNWTSGHIGAGGRGRIRYEGREQYAYRVAYQVYVGPIPDGMFVCHSCDNPRCVRPEHLFLGTHIDNMRDMHSKRRGSPPPILLGESNNMARLVERDVLTIRSRYAAGENCNTIAADYGIGRNPVDKIIRGIAWPHVGGPIFPGGRMDRPCCGTAAGAKRHKKAGEPVCGPCAEAMRTYQREQMRKSRARRALKAAS